MPIYEYECDKCGHEFEREQRMSDAPVKTCPKCKGRKVTKLISRSSFVLKGGGWYADGYSDPKAAKDKESSSDSDSTTESSSSDDSTKSSSDSTSDPKPKKAKDSSKPKSSKKKSAA